MTLIWFGSWELRGRCLWVQSKCQFCACLLRRSLILGGIIVKTMHLQQHDNPSLYGPMSSSAWFPSGRFANHLTIVKKDEYWCKYDGICRKRNQGFVLWDSKFYTHNTHKCTHLTASNKRFAFVKRLFIIVGIYLEVGLRDDLSAKIDCFMRKKSH